jgi:general secretion pathway protein E
VPIELEAAMNRLYPDGTDPEPAADAEAPLEDDADRLKDLASEAPVIRLVNLLITRAVETQASDIHIEPFEDRLRVRYRYDGVLHEAESPPRHLAAAITSRIKIMARLDIAERRMPQDGRIKMAVRGQDVDFRVSTIPSLYGETVVLRILDRTAVAFDYTRVGLSPSVIRRFSEALELPNGIVLVTGPTGSGKTTTLYTGLLALNAVTRKIITVEDPIEYQLDNVTQMEVNTKAGQTFATMLRSILRQDPDVIMIGEIRDQETASIACQAANTGHMVFSTVHSNDAVTALFRLLDLGVEPFMIASALSAVLGQRLVRLLCEACKEPYKPKPEFLKKANLPADKVDVFYRRPENPEQVCQQCGGTGYFGRTGIYELLVITEPMRDMIRENPSINKIKAEARKGGMIYLQEDGLRQVIQGKTSIEELLRVVK